MLRVKHIHMLLAAACASLTSLSIARADQLFCYADSANPGNGDDWGTACYSGGWAYAGVEVRESEGSIAISVTDHLDCPADTHLECGLGSSGDGDVACLGEGDYNLPLDGYLPAVLIYCGCYSGTCLGE